MFTYRRRNIISLLALLISFFLCPVQASESIKEETKNPVDKKTVINEKETKNPVDKKTVINEKETKNPVEENIVIIEGKTENPVRKNTIIALRGKRKSEPWAKLILLGTVAGGLGFIVGTRYYKEKTVVVTVDKIIYRYRERASDSEWPYTKREDVMFHTGIITSLMGFVLGIGLTGGPVGGAVVCAASGLTGVGIGAFTSWLAGHK